jgi:8-oxo-dGTP diphosphatase
VTVYFVRHAKAGHRSRWDGDDRERPLSRAGRHQAKLIAARLAARSTTTLVSSPFARCMQTLEPLATLTGATVVADDRLAEEQPFEPVLALLADLPDASVLCSHGDVIPETIAALERRGLLDHQRARLAQSHRVAARARRRRHVHVRPRVVAARSVRRRRGARVTAPR